MLRAKYKLKKFLAGPPRVQQKSFAKRIGIAGGYLSMLVCGARKPSRELIRKIKEETEGFITFDDWYEQVSDAKQLELCADLETVS